mgnify:CR=1 FL=1
MVVPPAVLPPVVVVPPAVLPPVVSGGPMTSEGVALTVGLETEETPFFSFIQLVSISLSSPVAAI